MKNRAPCVSVTVTVTEALVLCPLRRRTARRGHMVVVASATAVHRCCLITEDPRLTFTVNYCGRWLVLFIYLFI